MIPVGDGKKSWDEWPIRTYMGLLFQPDQAKYWVEPQGYASMVQAPDQAQIVIRVDGLPKIENRDGLRSGQRIIRAWLTTNKEAVSLGEIPMKNGVGELQVDLSGSKLRVIQDAEEWTVMICSEGKTRGRKPGENCLLKGVLEKVDLGQTSPAAFSDTSPDSWLFSPGGGSESFEWHTDNRKLWSVGAGISSEPGNPFPEGKMQILGVQFDERGEVRYMIHGLAGRNLLSDQPDAGQSGYRTFLPATGQSEAPIQWGYWLLYIDPKSGRVVEPSPETLRPTAGNTKEEPVKE